MITLIIQSIFLSFVFIYWLNLVLDYPLQDEFLKKYKSQSNYVLFVHSAIWGIGISFGLLALGHFAIWKMILLVIGHMLIDAWKCRGYYKKMNISDWHSLYIDQFLHVVQIIICLLF